MTVESMLSLSIVNVLSVEFVKVSQLAAEVVVSSSVSVKEFFALSVQTLPSVVKPMPFIS